MLFYVIKVVCVLSHSSTLWDPMDCLCPWDSPGKNTGVAAVLYLQGIFLTQECNHSLLYLLHWQAGSMVLSLAALAPPGKPIIKVVLRFTFSLSFGLVLPQSFYCWCYLGSSNGCKVYSACSRSSQSFPSCFFFYYWVTYGTRMEMPWPGGSQNRPWGWDLHKRLRACWDCLAFCCCCRFEI